MIQLGFTSDFGITATLWWLWLWLMWRVLSRCIGYRRINTFTLFLPMLLLTNGIFVPFSRDINLLITGFAITRFGDYWTALLLMYASLPVGVLLANLFRRPTREDVNVTEGVEVRSFYRVKLYAAAVLVISVVSLLQIFWSGLQFDLIGYVGGEMSYMDYATHRYGFALATSGLDYYLYNHLPYSIAPLSIILIWNAKAIAKWQKWIFLGILSFALLQTGHKMPLMTVAAYVIISEQAIKRNLVLTRKLVLGLLSLFALSVLVVLPAFYLLQGEGSYLLALYWSIIRTVGEPHRTLQLYFEVYPQYHSFLWGTSSRILAGIAGVTDFVPPSVYIPIEVLGLSDTSFPTLFIGEAWADFGYWGVSLVSIAVGFILQSYNVWFFNRQRVSLEDTALFLSIVLGSIHLLESNFFTSLLTYGLGVNFVIYLLIKGKGISAEPRRVLPEAPLPL